MTELTAVEIAKYESEKDMYWKMGIDIEAERYRQKMKALEPVIKALTMKKALETTTVLRVDEVGK